MISRIGLRLSGLFRRTAPDPFILAVLLTVLTAALALLIGFPAEPGAARAKVGERAVGLLDTWRGDGGLWQFLAFGMQMCLILVTGHALASSGPVRSGIRALAALPRGTASGAAMIGLVAAATGLINWGLGLIVGALLAREVGKVMADKGVPVHYPLLCAAGYMGLLVWHGGLSGSAPLTVTTPEGAAHVLPPEAMARLGEEGIGLGSTIFSPMNLVVTGGLVVLIPAVLALLAPKRAEDLIPMDLATGIGHARATDFGSANSVRSAPEGTDLTAKPAKSVARVGADSSGQESVARVDEPETIPDKLERSPILCWIIAVPLLLVLIRYADERGIHRIGLNEVNATMLALGLILHGSPRSYVRSVEEGARGCAGIILQFPLYAGIMGMMAASGLVAMFAVWLASVGGERTIPLMTFASAGVVNLFVPSGGGQWGIQGPIALEAGFAAGIEPGKMVMAVAYGDQLTNMLQPFWALPLLAITRIRARDIMSYTAVVMLVAAVWMMAGLLLF